DLKSIQKTLMQTEQKKTGELIEDLKRNIRNQAWEEKLKIAKDSYDRASAIDEQRRDASREAYNKAIEQGRKILEQLQDNREQYHKIIQEEKEQTTALRN